jgi:hypothetical protein
MVLTMTIHNCLVRTERADVWPSFGDLRLPAIDVVSIECRRTLNESLTAATAHAASVLKYAFSELQRTTRISFVLIGSKPLAVPSSRKVAALNAEREKLWNSWERDGVMLPVGRRVEWDAVVAENAVRYVGYIECSVEQLSEAIEVTRTRDALLWGVLDAPLENSQLTKLHSVVASSARRDEMLRSSLSISDGTILVMRGSGEFDDRAAVIEVFGAAHRVSLLARYAICNN